jgi:translation elongation factor EF-1alpha
MGTYQNQNVMKKENLKIVIVGRLKHGKSTLMERLIFDINSSKPRPVVTERFNFTGELGRFI